MFYINMCISIQFGFSVLNHTDDEGAVVEEKCTSMWFSENLVRICNAFGHKPCIPRISCSLEVGGFHPVNVKKL